MGEVNSERDCDHCGEAPGTVPLGSDLLWCQPCVDDAGDEFAVGYGWISREELEAKRAARAVTP